MATTMDNLKLPELIAKWMEVKKMRRNCGEALKVDAIDLTLLLQSIGFKLEYLDFEREKLNTDTLSVEIKCNKSGVLSRMCYDLVHCTCPEENEKETSFWEVQATAPKAFSKYKVFTSSNLLPEVSESCSTVTKVMLENLLDYYRTSMKSIEQGGDFLHSPPKVATPKINIVSPGPNVANPFATPPAEGKTTSGGDSNEDALKPLIDIDPAFSPMKPKSIAGSTDSLATKSSNVSTESIDIGNATREMSSSGGEEKPLVHIESILERAQVNVASDDNSFVNSEAMKALITSSPNEKIFDSILNNEQNHERDLNLIHCLQQARQQIDTALLVIKLNTANQDGDQTSIVTTTPQTVIRKKIIVPSLTTRSGSLTNIARRMSLPGRSSETAKLAAPAALSKKKLTGPSQLSATKPTTSRGDTPRPTAAQIKPVSLLRKTNSAVSPLSLPSTKPAPTAKKASVSMKVTGSARASVKVNSVMGRPATATGGDKK